MLTLGSVYNPTRRLEITNVSMINAGVYRCTHENKTEDITEPQFVDVLLAVQEKDIQTPDNNSNTKQDIGDIERKLTFIKQIKCLIVKNATIGSTTELPCENPPGNTVIQWLLLDTDRKITRQTYTDGYQVNTNINVHTRISIQPNSTFGNYALEITNVSISDAGEYRCTYKNNSLQLQRVDVRLVVQEKDVLTPDQEQDTKQEVEVNIERKLTVTEQFNGRALYIAVAIGGFLCVLLVVIAIAVRVLCGRSTQEPMVQEELVYMPTGTSHNGHSHGPNEPLPGQHNLLSFIQGLYEDHVDISGRMQNSRQITDESNPDGHGSEERNSSIENSENPYLLLKRQHFDSHVYDTAVKSSVQTGSNSTSTGTTHEYAECGPIQTGYINMSPRERM